MPTYEYACNTCSHEFEAFQSFSEDSLTTCPKCGGEVRKVFSNVGVVFKGSGFYKTDSRSSSESKPATPPPSDTPNKTSGKSESKPESKPATPPPVTPPPATPAS